MVAQRWKKSLCRAGLVGIAIIHAAQHVLSVEGTDVGLPITEISHAIAQPPVIVVAHGKDEIGIPGRDHVGDVLGSHTVIGRIVHDIPKVSNHAKDRRGVGPTDGDQHHEEAAGPSPTKLPAVGFESQH